MPEKSVSDELREARGLRRIDDLEGTLDALIRATLDYFPQDLPPRIGEALERGQKLLNTLES
jgi:hypothetical protein